MDGKLLAASRHGGRSGGGGCVVGERELFDEVFTHERCELIRLALTFWVIVRVLGERNIMAHVNVDLVCVCVCRTTTGALERGRIAGGGQQ